MMNTIGQREFLFKAACRFTKFLCMLVACALGETLPTRGGEGDELQFNRDVRPILAAACFRCHGMDANKREAGLRLDDAASATSVLDSGATAVVPGDIDASELWKRISAEDMTTVMPPPDAARQLSEEEKEVLRRWIEQGARFQKHWSFEPVMSPDIPPPDPNYPEWGEQLIDRYLLPAMLERGLRPNRQADKSTLIRRVAFTLTGLPPTLEQVDAYFADNSPTAYEAMVDRYLQSSGYGEEMARHWLDVARYGDTHGLHLDNDRQMWLYRDWVIDAFQNNMPFDQFTIEQLAGDLLPNATTSQKIATGFNRCNVTTSEGGAIDAEFLFRYAVDRTSTTVQTWLGLTAGCAVCHDHKYDPLTMKEFYSLYSFFYSAADPAMDGNINTTPPFLRVPSSHQEAELDRLRAAEAEWRSKLLAIARQEVNDRNECCKDKSETVSNSAIIGTPVESSTGVSSEEKFVVHLLVDRFPDGAGLYNTSRNPPVWLPRGSPAVPQGQRALKQEFGDRFEQIVQLGANPIYPPQNGKLTGWLAVDQHEPSDAVFVELRWADGAKRVGWAASAQQAAKVGVSQKEWLGALPVPGDWRPFELDLERMGIKKDAAIQEFKLGQFGGICYWSHLRFEGTGPGENDPSQSFEAWWPTRKGKDTPLAQPDINSALKNGLESVEAATKLDVEAFYVAFIQALPSLTIVSLRAAWSETKTSIEELEASIPGTLVFADSGEMRQAFVMKRGQYDQPDQPVSRATPQFLPELKALSDRPLNRLDLARWLVSNEQPLTARVTVNRFWQQVFGVGLVKTSEDFGTQGALPSHPELLDYLAHQFRLNGWNVRELMRWLVHSQAFRQDSAESTSERELDPENRWLARGPRIRLDAEQIRDNALAVSGLLSSKRGGPSVRPYQPPNIWEPVGYGDSNTRFFIQDHGDALYRRSIYTYIKRTAPPPLMSNFDAPNREQFCTRRERSNTPLQALQLLNDTQFVEAARKFAEWILHSGDNDVTASLRNGFRRCLSREPDEFERSELQRLYEKFAEQMKGRPEDAEKLLRVGESERDDRLDSMQLAAMTMIANLLFNLDEVTVRN